MARKIIVFCQVPVICGGLAFWLQSLRPWTSLQGHHFQEVSELQLAPKLVFDSLKKDVIVDLKVYNYSFTVKFCFTQEEL